MKNTFFRTRVPIYGGELTVHVVSDLKKAREATQSKYGEISGAHKYGWGLFSANDRHYGIFFLRDRIGHDIIAHEAVHLVHQIMADTGLSGDLYWDEPCAYLMLWAVGWITENLSEKKIAVKSKICL